MPNGLIVPYGDGLRWMGYYAECPATGFAAHRVWFPIKDFIEPIEDEM